MRLNYWILEYLDMPVPEEVAGWSIQQQHQYTVSILITSSDFEGSTKLTKVSTREIIYLIYEKFK